MIIFGIKFDDSFENIRNAFIDFICDSIEEDLKETEKEQQMKKAA